jgi:hypothetical protein
MAFISNGTTILDNGAFSVNLGSMVLISEQTASSSANISFTSGIDSTYPIYKFEYINIHPSNDAPLFRYIASTNGGSSYGVATTTTYFYAGHEESGASNFFTYETRDEAQSTNPIAFSDTTGADNDQSLSGEMFLYNPSSTTFVKHHMSRINTAGNADQSNDVYVAGYFNTTSSVNAIQFTFSSGNIDSGTIKLYGIKDS